MLTKHVNRMNGMKRYLVGYLSHSGTIRPILFQQLQVRNVGIESAKHNRQLSGQLNGFDVSHRHFRQVVVARKCVKKGLVYKRDRWPANLRAVSAAASERVTDSLPSASSQLFTQGSVFDGGEQFAATTAVVTAIVGINSTVCLVNSVVGSGFADGLYATVETKRLAFVDLQCQQKMEVDQNLSLDMQNLLFALIPR